MNTEGYASNAAEIIAAATIRRDEMVANLHPDDYGDYDFYLRFKEAWSSITFERVNLNVVRARLGSHIVGFDHITSECLDVDTVDWIFENGHITDETSHSALFTLDCNRSTCKYPTAHGMTTV